MGAREAKPPAVGSGARPPVGSRCEAPGGWKFLGNWAFFDALTAILGTEKQQN